MDEWIGNALFWALWFPAMAFFVAYLARVRLLRPAGLEPGELRHPWTTLALGIGGVLLFCGFALVIFLVGPEEFGGQRQQRGMIAIFLGGSTLGIPLVAEYYRGRHRVTDEGLRFQPLLRRGGFLKWSDVRRVRYSQVNKWFRLDGRSGEVARVSVLLIGLPEFARMLLDRASPEAIDVSAMPFLTATRDGHPPSIWG